MLGRWEPRPRIKLEWRQSSPRIWHSHGNHQGHLVLTRRGVWGSSDQTPPIGGALVACGLCTWTGPIGLGAAHRSVDVHLR